MNPNHLKIAIVALVAICGSGYQAMLLLGIGLVGVGNGPGVFERLVPGWIIGAVIGFASGFWLKDIRSARRVVLTALSIPPIGLSLLILLGMLERFEVRSLYWLLYSALVFAVPGFSFIIGARLFQSGREP